MKNNCFNTHRIEMCINLHPISYSADNAQEKKEWVIAKYLLWNFNAHLCIFNRAGMLLTKL